MNKALTIIVFIASLLFAQDSVAVESSRYDPDQALKLSQQVVGQEIGDYELLDSQGKVFRLRDDHAG